jgi:signal transduction histidine kinase
MAALFVDITARKQTEADLDAYRNQLEELVQARTCDLQRAQDDLVSAERLTTLGRLTATVGHELRSPLSTLRAALFNIGVAVERGSTTTLARAIEVAERSISRCDRIIDELLDYTRRTPPRLESTELDAWLAEVIDEIEHPAEIAMVRRLASGVRVQCDRDRLRRAVVNVVLNAVQAMEGCPSGRVAITTAEAGHHVEICVSDTGPGIPADQLPRIFEPLFSTKSFGVGLGLPIVRQVAEQHGGDVEVTSVLGQGTTVTLRLALEPRAGGAR